MSKNKEVGGAENKVKMFNSYLMKDYASQAKQCGSPHLVGLPISWVSVYRGSGSRDRGEGVRGSEAL